MVEYLSQYESARMALTSGSMKPTPVQVTTLLAAAAVLIPTTPVRYVTRFDPTPLFANLSTPAITAHITK
jgi:hypothetical protein